MKKFEVTITETSEMTIEIKARNKAEAEEIISDRWHNGDYILDADNFVGADFKAKPIERDRDER